MKLNMIFKRENPSVLSAPISRLLVRTYMLERAVAPMLPELAAGTLQQRQQLRPIQPLSKELCVSSVHLADTSP